jgi:hypothetical protein
MAEPKDEFLRLVERAIGVLKRHEMSDGLSDHDAMDQMYRIFEGSECRRLLELVPPSRRRRTA